jgi:hypothetical protein
VPICSTKMNRGMVTACSNPTEFDTKGRSRNGEWPCSLRCFSRSFSTASYAAPNYRQRGGALAVYFLAAQIPVDVVEV